MQKAGNEGNDACLVTSQVDVSGILRVDALLFNRINQELLFIVDELKDAPVISMERHLDTFQCLADRLRDCLSEVFEIVKAGAGVTYDQYLGLFVACTKRIDENFRQALPLAAWLAFESTVWWQITQARNEVFRFVGIEHRKEIRDRTLYVLDQIRRPQRSREEREMYLSFISDEQWGYAGFSPEERESVTREILNGPVIPSDNRLEVKHENS